MAGPQDKLESYSLDRIPELIGLYNASYLFAKEVGDLDWVHPMPSRTLAEFISKRELYGLNNQPDQVISSVRLHESNSSADILYIGKLAVSRKIKGTGFTEMRLLPAIRRKAEESGKIELRLNCLAHNTRLSNFYLKLGFMEIDERPALADAGYEVLIKELSLKI